MPLDIYRVSLDAPPHHAIINASHKKVLKTYIKIQLWIFLLSYIYTYFHVIIINFHGEGVPGLQGDGDANSDQ